MDRDFPALNVRLETKCKHYTITQISHKPIAKNVEPGPSKNTSTSVICKQLTSKKKILKVSDVWDLSEESDSEIVETRPDSNKPKF